MDDVRSDHLSCYGYQQKTSPNIDKVAQNGVIFENAFSTAEWSPPSHASLFTGKYPSYHKTLGMNLFLNKANTTLGDILSQNGYQTIGISCNPLIGSESGFNKGFQKYIDMSKTPLSFKWLKNPRAIIRTLIYGPDSNTFRATEIIKSFLKEKVVRRKPFLLFVNFMNGHHPYDPPKPFKKKFCKNFDECELFLIEFMLNHFFGKTTEKIYDSNLDIHKLRYIAAGKLFWGFMQKKLEISTEEWDLIKSWYDGEIAYLDYRIGNLVNFLKNNDLFEKTLLILTSDHGESFGEHRLATHTSGLYDSLIHVPLIMTYPDMIPKQKRIKNIVSIMDIFSTILEILDIRVHDLNVQSKSLYPFEERVFHEFVCAECGRRQNPFGYYEKGFKCLRSDLYKYILSHDGKEEFYNINDDPLEQVDLSQKYPEKITYLRKQLEKTIDISYFGYDIPKQKEIMLKRLKALGYL
jgi:arylsulfatase A-like enzyme